MLIRPLSEASLLAGKLMIASFLAELQSNYLLRDVAASFFRRLVGAPVP
jgi:hypothetical protein